MTREKSDFERIKNKQAGTLKKLFPGEKIEKNYKNTLQSLSDALEAEVKTMKGELHNAKME